MAKCLNCDTTFATFGGSKGSSCPTCRSKNIDTSMESSITFSNGSKITTTPSEDVIRGKSSALILKEIQDAITDTTGHNLGKSVPSDLEQAEAQMGRVFQELIEHQFLSIDHEKKCMTIKDWKFIQNAAYGIPKLQPYEVYLSDGEHIGNIVSDGIGMSGDEPPYFFLRSHFMPKAELKYFHIKLDLDEENDHES